MSDGEKPLLSFLIPALNEASNIGGTLSAIRQYVPPSISWEVIVGDHGSCDGTCDIALKESAQVLDVSGGTIAALRNQLAEAANGQVLVFNDADILLTPEWSHTINQVIVEILSQPKTIVGATLVPLASDNWITRNWFSLQSHTKKTYVSTGHMILTKDAFEKLSGFDKALSSGEDYELCVRAKKNKFEIKNVESLRAIHLDYPDNLKTFFLREIWHGSGDFVSLSTFARSRVAIVASLFAALITLTILSVPISRMSTLILFSAALAIPVYCSLWKFPGIGISRRPANILIWTMYLAARALSVTKRHRTQRFYKAKPSGST